MEIVNSNTMFTLVSITNEVAMKNIIILNLDCENHKKYQLTIEGIKEKDLFLQKINNYINSYIDIDEVEKWKLDIWSDAEQIGIFEVKNYTENVTDFTFEDWKNEYRNSIEYHKRLAENHIKEAALKDKFMGNLNFLLNKEIKNTKQKNEFSQDKSASIKANKKILKLANKILNLMDQYNIELKESRKN